MAINWLGDAVKRKVRKAERLAIDATMSAAIQHAKSNHGAGAHAANRFITHSGGAGAEGAIRIVMHARSGRGGTAGRWGAIGIVYFRRLELGFQGKVSKGRVIDAQPYPSLRPAAIAEYPKLAKRIKGALARA